MAMPQGHLVAFCSDLGITPSMGAAMLSVLLGTAFISRQFWGYVADRIGGINTVLASSACQAAAIAALLVTQDEVGLFTVVGSVRLRLQRPHSRLCPGYPRVVPGARSGVAGADLDAVQRFGDGVRRLARGRAL